MSQEDWPKVAEGRPLMPLIHVSYGAQKAMLDIAQKNLEEAQNELAKEWEVDPWQVPFLFLRHRAELVHDGHGCNPDSCYTETGAVNKYLSAADTVLELLEDIRLP